MSILCTWNLFLSTRRVTTWMDVAIEVAWPPAPRPRVFTSEINYRRRRVWQIAQVLSLQP
jgi:hypothetical protein